MCSTVIQEAAHIVQTEVSVCNGEVVVSVHIAEIDIALSFQGYFSGFEDWQFL